MFIVKKKLVLIFVSAFLFTGHIATVDMNVAHAQQSSQINDVQELLAWNQQYTEAYTTLTSIFGTASIAALYETDFEDLEATKRAYSNFNAQREAILAKATNMFADLPPPERWDFDRSLFSSTDRARYKATTALYRNIPETIESVREASDYLPFILALEKGDLDTAMANFIDQQVEASIQVIKSENKQIDNFLLAIPKDNPNYQFQIINKAINNFSLVELEFGRKTQFDYAFSSERQAYADLMDKELEDIPALIALGRQNIKTTNKTLRDAKKDPKASPAELAFVEKVIEAMNSFEDSFLVEEKIYENSRKAAELMRSNLEGQEFEAQSDMGDLEFFDLIDQRAQIFTNRLSMMQ